MTETFKQTSDEPYDRHNYKLVYSNGQEVFFEDYMDVQAAWCFKEFKYSEATIYHHIDRIQQEQNLYD